MGAEWRCRVSLLMNRNRSPLPLRRGRGLERENGVKVAGERADWRGMVQAGSEGRGYASGDRGRRGGEQDGGRATHQAEEDGLEERREQTNGEAPQAQGCQVKKKEQ